MGEDGGAAYSAAVLAANRLVNEGMSWSGRERNCCFLNTTKLRFANISATAGLDLLDDGSGLLYYSNQDPIKTIL